MTPALFALFIRSLRDDLRSRTMMWARAGMAGAVLFIMFQFTVTRLFGAAGRDFFESVVHRFERGRLVQPQIGIHRQHPGIFRLGRQVMVQEERFTDPARSE